MVRPAAADSLLPMTIPASALALLCAALWGGTSVAIQFSQDAWPPLGTAGMRFALGVMVVGLWCLVGRQPMRIQPGQGVPIIVVGVMLFVQIALFHIGLNRTDSAHGSVMIGSNPLWVALLAHFALKGDRLTALKILGLLVATAGVVIVVVGAEGAKDSARVSATLTGDAIVLVSSWLLGLKMVYTKHGLASVEPAKLLFWSSLLGTVLLLAAGAIFEGVDGYRYSRASLLGLLYQGLVVAGFCFAAWTWLLRRHRASQLAVFGFAQPLFGMLFGVWLRGDAVNPALLIGGASVAAGILIVTRQNRAT